MLLETLFRLNKAGTSVRTELLAGLATFLTMAYITIVNPITLSTEGTGMAFGAVFTATIIAADSPAGVDHPAAAAAATAAGAATGAAAAGTGPGA